MAIYFKSFQKSSTLPEGRKRGESARDIVVQTDLSRAAQFCGDDKKGRAGETATLSYYTSMIASLDRKFEAGQALQSISQHRRVLSDARVGRWVSHICTHTYGDLAPLFRGT